MITMKGLVIEMFVNCMLVISDVKPYQDVLPYLQISILF